MPKLIMKAYCDDYDFDTNSGQSAVMTVDVDSKSILKSIAALNAARAIDPNVNALALRCAYPQKIDVLMLSTEMVEKLEFAHDIYFEDSTPERLPNDFD